MPDSTKAVNTKFIVGILQWIISALAIPALVWAWTLSTKVAILERQNEELERSATKSEEQAIELAKMNATLEHLKESLDEIKTILRD